MRTQSNPGSSPSSDIQTTCTRSVAANSRWQRFGAARAVGCLTCDLCYKLHQVRLEKAELWGVVQRWPTVEGLIRRSEKEMADVVDAEARRETDR